MFRSRPCAFLTLAAWLLFAAASAKARDDKRDALWAAVRGGDAKAVAAALDNGADVNAKNEMGVSALWIAAGKDKLDVIELLVRRGADVNARDGIWYQTPLSSAVAGRRLAAAKLLIKAGAKDVDAALFAAARQGNEEMVGMILDQTKVSRDALDAALYATTTAKKEKLEKTLRQAGARPLPTASAKDRAAWQKIAGDYESDGGAKMVLTLEKPGLVYGGRWLKPSGDDAFVPLGSEGMRVRIERRGEDVARIILSRFTAEYSFYRFGKPVERPAAAAEIGASSAGPPLNWPAFRGPDGTGVADGQHPPVTWNLKESKNVRWKTPIPGLGHSCPIVWGKRVFVTTAVSSDANPKIRIGNYGDVASVDDKSKHTWQVLCLDRDSGAILWTRTACQGVPKIKRHLKGSQANCTPATDGTHVLACFGSEGLYCYDFAGKLLWKRDLSTLDSSFAIDQEYEWGFGNSPLIHDGLAILQCDLSRDSFLAAFNVESGEKVWSTPRDEIPSWSSPVIWRNSRRVELVTNAAQYARGYDPKTGAELWRLAKKSEVTIPTPVCGKDLLFIASGNRPIQPIFAIRPGASGDISLKQGQKSNAHIAWSKMRGGPYMPTPLLYGPYLYTCSNSGVLACYEAATGKEVYKERISSGGDSYTASPVAADGHLYFASEQGQIRVVKAGPAFELLAVNAVDDYVMATPAISNGSLFVRSQHFLMSLANTAGGKVNPSAKDSAPPRLTAKRPNIVFILTDDQGYGDLSAHGNPILKTPHIDRLHAEAVRFTDFHVSPTCSPTRSALLTGRHEFKNGVTHTILERERLTLKAVTLAEVLKSAGYTTGIFGKWHLGDEPDRWPSKRGFDEMFIHGCGGIGQTHAGSCGDAPGNTYFNPAILHNGRFEKTDGYCTDVFFAQASKWIESVKGEQPFFCYIPTNAPHGPLQVRGEDEARYKDKVKQPDAAKFFGMIANIDDNVGRLVGKLKEWGLEKETLIVFMTDNGGTVGVPIFNTGMRGQKATPWLGGTRAVSLWRWPGALAPADCDRLTAHIDFLPTLAELAGAKLADAVKKQIEGRSLVGLLENPKAPWEDRTLFTHVGRWPKGAKVDDHKYDGCSVRSTRWHMVSAGKDKLQWQLFDVKADPGEKTNIADKHPDVVKRLDAEYDKWWSSLPPYLVNEAVIGPKENPFKVLYRKQFGTAK